MALPFEADKFDAAVMALVLVFVPDPGKGVAEMVRVVRPGGIVAAYIWDMVGGGFPLDPILMEMRAMGLAPPQPPRVEASRMDVLRGLWTDAGLDAVESREIAVTRTFVDFDNFWMINAKSPTLRPTVDAMAPEDVEALKSRLRARLPADFQGHITFGARAHAVSGHRPS